jgi:hypothetical protein
MEAVEFETLEWVGVYGNRGLLSSTGNVPPAEAEAAHDESLEVPEKMAAWRKSTSLRQRRGGSFHQRGTR